VGACTLYPAPYYQEHGVAVTLQFSAPLKAADIQRLNNLGHWLNETAIVRLEAVLREYGILSNNPNRRIDWRMPGAVHVDLARRLRHMIMKEGGRYKRGTADHDRLMGAIVQTYGVEPTAETFPMPIDRVIVPMTKGCREYAIARN
jgi:hypothetical protein